jgi:MarR family transcriptional regulator, temperature-dependent positive regulator of motility
MIEHGSGFDTHGTPSHDDASFRLLSLIERHPDYSQRKIAETMGISLGKAHYLLKALFDKGLVKAGKLGRQPSKLLYVLTPDGVRHRMQLTRLFLQRKELEFETLKSQIEQLRAEVDGGSSVTSAAGQPADPSSR